MTLPGFGLVIIQNTIKSCDRSHDQLPIAIALQLARAWCDRPSKPKLAIAPRLQSPCDRPTPIDLALAKPLEENRPKVLRLLAIVYNAFRRAIAPPPLTMSDRPLVYKVCDRPSCLLPLDYPPPSLVLRSPPTPLERVNGGALKHRLWLSLLRSHQQQRVRHQRKLFLLQCLHRIAKSLMAHAIQVN
jgi:hypothetical protein